MDNRSAAQRYKDLPGEEKGRFNYVHRLLMHILQEPSGYSIKVTKDTPQIVEQLEFILQDILGYERNADFHKYWPNIDGCTCPKLDNLEQLGYGRIISEDCPFHGKVLHGSNSCLQSSKNYHK